MQSENGGYGGDATPMSVVSNPSLNMARFIDTPQASPECTPMNCSMATGDGSKTAKSTTSQTFFFPPAPEDGGAASMRLRHLGA